MRVVVLGPLVPVVSVVVVVVVPLAAVVVLAVLSVVLLGGCCRCRFACGFGSCGPSLVCGCGFGC